MQEEGGGEVTACAIAAEKDLRECEDDRVLRFLGVGGLQWRDYACHIRGGTSAQKLPVEAELGIVLEARVCS